MNAIQSTISASPLRRMIAISLLVTLGGLMIFLAFATPPRSLYWQGFLLFIGGAALYASDRLRRATLLTIELLEDRIVDSAGRELCRLDNIKSVERGAFAFKPSNGFLIHLKEPMPRVWALGLWWRFGRSVGVGGVTPASQSKLMADLITIHLAGGLPI